MEQMQGAGEGSKTRGVGQHQGAGGIQGCVMGWARELRAYQAKIHRPRPLVMGMTRADVNQRHQHRQSAQW